MDTILATAGQLNTVLLETDDEAYNDVALETLQELKKVQLPETATVVQALQQIDPATLTIPYFYLLGALLDSNLPSSKSSSRSVPQALLPDGNLWPAVTNALLTFDPIQIRYVGTQLSKVVEVVYHGAEQTSNYVPAIQLLNQVVLRTDPTISTLSNTHYYYIKACMNARAYYEAVSILDFPIYHVPTAESTKTLERRMTKCLCSSHESSLAYINSKTGLSDIFTSRMYLEYFFMAALCYLGTEQWKKAQAFLEVVLVAPTQQNVASLIMVEAYRKWILIGLIINGKIPESPRTMSSNALKHIRPIAKPYECVAEAFRTNKFELLYGEVQEGIGEWQNDGNYGLVLEVVAAFRKFSVIRLSKTFAALPIEDVAQRMSSEPSNVQETLSYVQSLIASGSLRAQITSSQTGSLGTVRFLPPTAAQKSEAEVEQELRNKAAELKILLKHISDYDYQLEVNKEYIEWLQKVKKTRDQDKKAGLKGATNSVGLPPPPDMDEEMMDDWA